jgi:SAM-dependent methyltransferase
VGADLRTRSLTAAGGRCGTALGRLRSLVRRRLPQAAALAGFARTLPLRWRSAEAVFTAIYRRNAWRGEESASGPGSSLEATAALRGELPRLLAELGCSSLLDAPCGDLCWLEQAPLPIGSYCGVDIVEAVIAANRCRHAAPGRTFLCLDLRRDPLPEADLVLCRDCLVHFSFRDARAALSNLRDCGATWLLTTTFPAHPRNRDAVTGEWRPLNLELPPFRLPPPLALLDERCREEGGRYPDKSLGLWRFADLPPLV